MSPALLFRRVAVAEAITWALLLTGMFLKYVTETTELGVSVFGMLHGVVFVAYGVVTLVVAVDQRWRPGRTLAALACAVPPFATVPFARWGDVFGDQVVAAAMIDHIVHHAEVLTLKGSSYRLKDTGIDTLPSARADNTAR